MSQRDYSPTTLPAQPESKVWHLEIWWTQFRVPLQVGMVAGILTALLTIAMPNQYKSVARILPADPRSSMALSAAAAAAAAAGVSIPGQEGSDNAYVDILNSYSIREALLKTYFTFKLRTWYFGSEQIRNQTLYDFLERKNLDRAITALKGRITITRELKTRLISIAVETESPELSQLVVQRLVFLLDEFVVGKSQTRGGLKAAFADKRLTEARTELILAEDAFRVFLNGNRNYLLSTDPAVKLKGIRLDNELKLRTQLVTTLSIGREQALLEEKNDMPILNVLDKGNLPIDKSRPMRSYIVLFSSLLLGGGTWGWLNRFRFLHRAVEAGINSKGIEQG